MTAENLINSFPSQFAPPTVKNSQKYTAQYNRAFHEEAAHLPTESALVRNNKNYDRFRKYARGEQSQQQYKESMAFQKIQEGGKPRSFRNVNYEILKIVPKLKNVIVNKVVNQPFRMRARAIDPKSISEKRKQKSKLLEFIINKEEIERFERLTKLGLERPVPPGEMPPATAAEIDPYMDMNPKDITCMEVLDYLTLAFQENDWHQLGREIVGDIFDLGVGGTRQYIDVNGKIKFRRVLPERCITNKCIYPDFRDLIRFGEYVDMTVSELKRETKGSLGEDAYREIANGCEQGKNKYINNTVGTYFNEDTYSYAYDHEKVTVLKTLWYSVDSEVHVEFQNEAGNARIKKMEYNYVPFKGDKNVNNGKGLSDDEFNQLNNGKKKIYRTEVRNVYQCSWVVGTDYVYDHGLMKNMLRPSGNWQETVMPVTLISTDFVSTMSVIEQPVDQVQLNYLHYQSHVAASKPPGIAIERNALARIGKSGGATGGKKWDPKEDLIMYAESGNLLYDGYDTHGQPLAQLPFKELVNGLSAGAQEHWNLMIQSIDLIRNMIGINTMTEGQTPPERIGKDVANLSFGASDNALSHLTDAYKSVYERTARNMFYLLQNNVQRMDPDMLTQSLGSESYKHFALNDDLGLLDMGIILEEGPDDQVREGITELLKLMVTNQEIPGEDAIAIQMIDNPYRQLLMLRKHRQEREKQKAAEQENVVRAQGEENTKTAVAVEQEAQKTKQLEHKLKMAEKAFEADEKEKEGERQFKREVFLKKMEMDNNDADTDKNLIHDFITTMMDNQKEIAKQKLANQKKTQTT